jgi:hypothetical protein
MCDYSLQHVKNRAVNVADKLTVHQFGMGTAGFRGADDTGETKSAIAVCLLPGTELAFEGPVTVGGLSGVAQRTITEPTARFRQINKEQPYMHHDALEFGDGDFVLLTHLKVGQTATVLQLPAAPKNEAELKEQTRLEVVA